MKKILLAALFVLAIDAYAQSFESYFKDSTLLIDLQHYGTDQTEGYALQKLSKKRGWDRSKKALIAPSNYGNHIIKLYDMTNNLLIFSNNFCSLFNEWQSTDEAKNTKKSFSETVAVPLPKSNFRMELYTRNKQGKYDLIQSQEINPCSFHISNRPNSLTNDDIHIGDSIENAIDIVILPEGYDASEHDKFIHDCRRFADALFSYSPFKENKRKFNIRGVWSPSKESGATIPKEGIWKQTTLQSQFWTFNSERYLMVENQQIVAHSAHSAPCEFIYILTNTDKYGGGGIYNFYAIGAASHPTKTAEVHVHEFGHLFVGLADEYDSDASVNEVYPDGVEPWELNITRQINWEHKYWSKMIEKNSPIPTPQNYHLPKGAVGLYEGAGYLKKGIYRPTKNCMMRNLVAFCPVCQKALQEEINRLTE